MTPYAGLTVIWFIICLCDRDVAQLRCNELDCAWYCIYLLLILNDNPVSQLLFFYLWLSYYFCVDCFYSWISAVSLCSYLYLDFMPLLQCWCDTGSTRSSALLSTGLCQVRTGRLLWPSGGAVKGQLQPFTAIGRCMHDLRHFVPKMCFAKVDLLVAL